MARLSLKQTTFVRVTSSQLTDKNVDSYKGGRAQTGPMAGPSAPRLADKDDPRHTRNHFRLTAEARQMAGAIGSIKLSTFVREKNVHKFRSGDGPGRARRTKARRQKQGKRKLWQP